MKSMFPRSPDLKVSTLQAAIRKANHYLAQGVGIAALAAVGATAQAAEEEKKEKEISEEIIVKGIRGSLAEASALKRNANGFLDAIVAEDIGKLPDNNDAGVTSMDWVHEGSFRTTGKPKNIICGGVV